MGWLQVKEYQHQGQQQQLLVLQDES